MSGHDKKRRFFWPTVLAAGCICILFILMFVNKTLPFFGEEGQIDSAGGTGTSVDELDYANGPTASADPWKTAGEAYKDLFALINEHASIADNGGLIGAMDTGADASAPSWDGSTRPVAPEDVSVAENAPPGETATAGSGYESMDPQFPADRDDGTAASDERDYSETNEQMAGVREADVLKTDGKYIYAVNSKNLWIVEADNGVMTLLSKIPQPDASEGQIYFEMYVSGDRLIAIRHGYNQEASLRAGDAKTAGLGAVTDDGMAQTRIAYPIRGYLADTSVDIFDISDRTAPVKLHTLSQSGDYNDSRMVGGYLYLLTAYYTDPAQIDEDDPRTFVPLYARDGEQYTPDASDIYLPEETSRASYTVISGIDATGGGDFVSRKSIYGDTGSVYVSPNALYLTRSVREETREEYGSGDRRYIGYTNWMETVISKLTFESGKVEPRARARVPGYVLNPFSLDEYGGALRLVTTNDRSIWYGFKDMNRTYSDKDWAMLPASVTKTANALYTLDADLNRIGSIEELAPDERVYSCRFMGDIAYFATFRQTDPLFSVDISAPENPQTLGMLKISGFSEYLHPYAAGRLFGLGRDANIATGARRGLKLTMFDSSDPADVRELHTLALGDEYSAAEQNHKAILVSADKALIAFPTEDHYLVYGYDDVKGFERIAEIAFAGDGWAEIRGLFLGEIFYVVGPNNLNAYAIMDAFTATGSLTVDEGASSVSRRDIRTPGVIMPFGE